MLAPLALIPALALLAPGSLALLHCLPASHLGGPTLFVVLDRSPAGVLLAGPLRWEDWEGSVYELRIVDWGPDGMTGWLSRWPAGPMGE
jgi:hypothetical protein